MVLGVRGAKHTLEKMLEVIHRATHVHQQQQLDAVSPWWPEYELDFTAVAGATVDRIVQVELLGPFVLVEPLQTAQRDADLTGVENPVGAEVAISPGAGDLHCRPAATAAADPHAGGMLAAMTERRRAARANPAVAAVVAFFLLF